MPDRLPHVGLIFLGVDLIPDRLTAATNLLPTQQFVRGEFRRRKDGRLFRTPNRHSGWSYSPSISSNRVVDHLSAVLETFVPLIDAIDAACGDTIEMRRAGTSIEAWTYGFPSRLLQPLAAITDEVLITYYDHESSTRNSDINMPPEPELDLCDPEERASQP